MKPVYAYWDEDALCPVVRYDNLSFHVVSRNCVMVEPGPRIEPLPVEPWVLDAMREVARWCREKT